LTLSFGNFASAAGAAGVQTSNTTKVGTVHLFTARSSARLREVASEILLRYQQDVNKILIATLDSLMLRACHAIHRPGPGGRQPAGKPRRRGPSSRTGPTPS